MFIEALKQQVGMHAHSFRSLAEESSVTASHSRSDPVPRSDRDPKAHDQASSLFDVPAFLDMEYRPEGGVVPWTSTSTDAQYVFVTTYHDNDCSSNAAMSASYGMSAWKCNRLLAQQFALLADAGVLVEDAGARVMRMVA